MRGSAMKIGAGKGVQNPGKLGGKFFKTESGAVRYGAKPNPRATPVPSAAKSFLARRQGTPSAAQSFLAKRNPGAVPAPAVTKPAPGAINSVAPINKVHTGGVKVQNEGMINAAAHGQKPQPAEKPSENVVNKKSLGARLKAGMQSIGSKIKDAGRNASFGARLKMAQAKQTASFDARLKVAQVKHGAKSLGSRLKEGLKAAPGKTVDAIKSAPGKAVSAYKDANAREMQKREGAKREADKQAVLQGKLPAGVNHGRRRLYFEEGAKEALAKGKGKAAEHYLRMAKAAESHEYAELFMESGDTKSAIKQLARARKLEEGAAQLKDPPPEAGPKSKKPPAKKLGKK